MRFTLCTFALSLSMLAAVYAPAQQPADIGRLSVSWSKNMLSIRGPQVPGESVETHYLEAYCRPGSTDRLWQETTIGHTTELLSASPDGRSLELRCTLKDGVQVSHRITAGKDEVDFQLVAHNPTTAASLAHWAQPCMRVDKFTGKPRTTRAQENYLPQSFIFVDGQLVRMPTQPWATTARYIPGQVWCPKHVDRNDVNPRPLSSIVPSNGLIGCFSTDGKQILATAWEPYQELFQGVISCLHSDFRIGGLAPGETKRIRGKVYIVPADVAALVERYQKDFPEQR
jgi:hypothetical protein